MKKSVSVTSESYVKLSQDNYFRITLGSCIRLTFGKYVIKPCKWDKKTRSITFGRYVRFETKISLELYLEVTLELRLEIT